MNETYRLTEKDAAIVKGLRARGEKQQDITAYYILMYGSINPGRIADICTGEKFPNIEAADPRDLPPSLSSVFEKLRSLLEIAAQLIDIKRGK